MPELMPYYGMSGDDPRLLYSRGYVAPNVSDFGEVISPGRDDRLSPQEWDYVQRELAVRDAANEYAAKQELQQRVAAGEDPVDAFRQLAPRLISDMRTYARFLQSDANPEIRDIDGTRVLRTGPRTWRPLSEANAVTPEIRLMERDMDRLDRERRTLLGRDLRTPEEDTRLRDLEDQIGSLRGRIAEATEAPTIPAQIEPPAPETIQPRGRFDEQQEMFNRLANPESQGQRSRERMDTLNSDKVVVIKDGRRYRLPRSQLKDAINQGYELAP